MRSEKLTHPIAPAAITQDLIRTEEDYDYSQIGKGIVHALVIPFILAFVDPILSISYIACAMLLYSTVFRHKSDGFFGVVIFSLLISAIMIIPG